MTDTREERGGARPGFPSPFEVPIPPACDGWEEMYPRHAPFSEDRRAYDESRFWFHDGVHFGEPLYPFDAMVARLRHRRFQPGERAPVRGPVLARDRVPAPERLRLSERELGHRRDVLADERSCSQSVVATTTSTGTSSYARWRDRVEQATRSSRPSRCPILPDVEDETVVTDGRGLGSSYALCALRPALEGFDRIWHTTSSSSTSATAPTSPSTSSAETLPRIADQTIAKMVSGIDAVLWRPDEELKRLAGLALELGVEEREGRRERGGAPATSRAATPASGGSPTSTRRRTRGSTSPTGPAPLPPPPFWIDDTTLPIAIIGSYIERLEAGEDIARPRDGRARRA